jgi:hypothetical protein
MAHNVLGNDDDFVLGDGYGKLYPFYEEYPLHVHTARQTFFRHFLALNKKRAELFSALLFLESPSFFDEWIVF